jgi:hypothetical protein
VVLGLVILGVFPSPSELEAASSMTAEPPASMPTAVPDRPVEDRSAREAPAQDRSALPPVPWSVLKDRRVSVTTHADSRLTGTFLGLEDGYAVLATEDGTLLSIPTRDVAKVRIVPVIPPPPIPMPATDMSLAFRDDEARLERRRTLRRAQGARGASIAGGVIASLSAVSSVIAEGFNIRRWSLSSHACGEWSYGGGDACGWTDGGEPHDQEVYWYYDENISGIAGASTIAVPLHVVGGLTTLIPTALLRGRIGYRGHRGRQVAAWVLWGAGLGSLTANQAVAWTQVANVGEVCNPAGANCVWITPTRGAPPSLYLMSAGFTLASTILGIIDAQDVARRAEASVSGASAKRRGQSTVSVFPLRLQRGGGVGLAGRF